MKYFIDTEFIESFHKPLFGKRRHFIDLISIGIYCEDGREYHAISNEYNCNDADDWVKENVILPLYSHTCSGDARNHFYANNFQKFYGKPNKQIAAEIMTFVFKEAWLDWIGSSDEFIERGKRFGWYTDTPIEFYGYYSDYDWVLFCSLFGRMIDLPNGFPRYCIDLKQTLDEKINAFNWQYGRDIWSNSLRSIHTIGIGQTQEKDRPATFDEKLKVIKELSEYPKQTNEHNALADAKWNYELYKFLTSI